MCDTRLLEHVIVLVQLLVKRSQVAKRVFLEVMVHLFRFLIETVLGSLEL